VCPATDTACADASATEEPDAGKLHVRVCAGGRRVTDVPTAAATVLSLTLQDYRAVFFFFVI
jgi:hypothetical protein